MRTTLDVPVPQRLRPLSFLLGFGVLYAVLAGLAEVDATGRLGVAILLAVVITAIAVEWVIDRTRPATSLRLLGFGRPRGRAVLVALAIAALLQAVFPLVSGLTGRTLALRPGWPWLLVGIFAFHGLAEELVWRGYAFRRLRRGHSFAWAVTATMPLLAATHLPVIVTSGVVVGVAAMLVAAVTTLPLARLFEAGGNTIWAPAIVHVGIDSFKLVDIPAEASMTLSLTLAAASLTVPMLAFAATRTHRRASSPAEP